MSIKRRALVKQGDGTTDGHRSTETGKVSFLSQGAQKDGGQVRGDEWIFPPSVCRLRCFIFPFWFPEPALRQRGLPRTC